MSVCLSVRREVTGSSLTSNQKLQLARDTGGWRTPLCTLAKALATGKTTSEFNVLDKNEIRVDTYFSLSPDGEAAGFMANY